MKKRWCVMILSIAIFVIIMVGFFMHQNNNYLTSVESMLPIILEYNDVVIKHPFFTSDYVSRLKVAKRHIFWGTINRSQTPVIINIPSKAELKIYPNDDTSVLIEYIPHSGWSQKYKLSEYGDFDKHLEILYEITNNDVFQTDAAA